MNIILLPIHPEYVHKIFRGTKQVEFRKVHFRKTINAIILYSTAPESKIVGLCTVKSIIVSGPKELWLKFQHCAGINQEKYNVYFEGHEKGTAIKIEDTIRFSRGVKLSELSTDVFPPRGFRYVSEAFLIRICEICGEEVDKWGILQF